MKLNMNKKTRKNIVSKVVNTSELNMNKKTRKNIVSKDVNTSVAGGNVKDNVQRTAGGQGEKYIPSEWTGSEAATHAGTQVTGDGTMAKTIESRNEARLMGEIDRVEDKNIPLVTASTSSSTGGESKHTPNSNENGSKKDVSVKEAEFVGCNSPLLGGKCLSGSIPDYVFVCQNWY